MCEWQQLMTHQVIERTHAHSVVAGTYLDDEQTATVDILVMIDRCLMDAGAADCLGIAYVGQQALRCILSSRLCIHACQPGHCHDGHDAHEHRDDHDLEQHPS